MEYTADLMATRTIATKKSVAEVVGFLNSRGVDILLDSALNVTSFKTADEMSMNDALTRLKYAKTEVDMIDGSTDDHQKEATITAEEILNKIRDSLDEYYRTNRHGFH